MLGVEGELTLVGRQGPIRFDLAIGVDGSIGATAVVTQTRWGLKPFTTMFGALKALDALRERAGARRSRWRADALRRVGAGRPGRIAARSSRRSG